jgi:hypothetical protein
MQPLVIERKVFNRIPEEIRVQTFCVHFNSDRVMIFEGKHEVVVIPVVPFIQTWRLL